MGQFSWLDCDALYENNRQIINGKREDVYVLVPKEFGGGHIKESQYDGYGIFGGIDVFDLVAEWNRNYFPNDENRISPVFTNEVIEDYLSKKYNEDEMSNKYGFDWKKTIGIHFADNDVDNAQLKYPIKITHREDLTYEQANFSLSDPNQGWEINKNEYENWHRPDYAEYKYNLIGEMYRTKQQVLNDTIIHNYSPSEWHTISEIMSYTQAEQYLFADQFIINGNRAEVFFDYDEQKYLTLQYGLELLSDSVLNVNDDLYNKLSNIIDDIKKENKESSKKKR